MKRVLLSVLGALIGFTGFAQSLQASGDTIVYDSPTSVDIVAHIDITNVSSDTINVRVKRIGNYNGNALTDSNALCWGALCFNPSVSVSPTTSQILPGATSMEFSAHVYPDPGGVSDQGDITYVFYDDSNSNDTVAFTVTYNTQSFGISTSKIESHISEPYPNPSSKVVYFDYSLADKGATATIELTDMLGNAVKQVLLDASRKSVKIDLSEVQSGIYFYSFEVDGKMIATRRMVVSRQ